MKSAWIVLSVLAAGCVHLSSMPIGAGAPPRAGSVRIEHITAKEAEQRYTEVGLVCISSTNTDSPAELERNADATEQLFERARSLGGEVVVPLGMCHLQTELARYGGAEGFEYHVYRAGAPVAVRR